MLQSNIKLPRAEFLAAALLHFADDGAQGVGVEDARDGVAHFERRCASRRFRSDRAGPVGGTDAGDRGEGTVEQADDRAEGDFVEILIERVAASTPRLLLRMPPFFRREQKFVRGTFGNFGPLGDEGDLQELWIVLRASADFGQAR